MLRLTYLLFPVQCTPPPVYHETPQRPITDIPIDTFTDLNSAFSIKWSADNSAFTLKTVTNFAAQRVYYVTGFTSSVRKFIKKELDLSNVVDISADGSNILSIAHGQALYINIADFSQTHLLSESGVLGAVFLPEDNGKVLLLLQDRAARYDLLTQSVAVLSSNANIVLKSIVNVDLVSISPLANMAAVVSIDRDRDRSAIYLILIRTS